MRAPLFAVGCIGMLARLWPRGEERPAASARGFWRPNARHHPPRRAVSNGKFSMRAALFAVGCMPLLDCALARAILPLGREQIIGLALGLRVRAVAIRVTVRLVESDPIENQLTPERRHLTVKTTPAIRHRDYRIRGLNYCPHGSLRPVMLLRSFNSIPG